jgi:hypothetical protein
MHMSSVKDFLLPTLWRFNSPYLKSLEWNGDDAYFATSSSVVTDVVVAVVVVVLVTGSRGDAGGSGSGGCDSAQLGVYNWAISSLMLLMLLLVLLLLSTQLYLGPSILSKRSPLRVNFKLVPCARWITG